MNELGFLADLLANHKLPKATKALVAQRMNDVAESFQAQHVAPVRQPVAALPPGVAAQAPSMQAIMARHPDLVPAPVAAVAQNPTTAAALAARQAVINQGMSGKPEPGRTSPRKF